MWILIQSKTRGHIFKNQNVALNFVRNEGYVLLLESTDGAYLSSQPPCDLLVLDQYLPLTHHVFAMRKDNWLVDKLDDALIQLQQRGSLQRLYHTWWNTESCWEDSDNERILDGNLYAFSEENSSDVLNSQFVGHGSNINNFSVVAESSSGNMEYNINASLSVTHNVSEVYNNCTSNGSVNCNLTTISAVIDTDYLNSHGEFEHDNAFYKNNSANYTPSIPHSKTVVESNDSTNVLVSIDNSTSTISTEIHTPTTINCSIGIKCNEINYIRDTFEPNISDVSDQIHGTNGMFFNGSDETLNDSGNIIKYNTVIGDVRNNTSVSKVDNLNTEYSNLSDNAETVPMQVIGRASSLNDTVENNLNSSKDDGIVNFTIPPRFDAFNVDLEHNNASEEAITRSYSDIDRIVDFNDRNSYGVKNSTNETLTEYKVMDDTGTLSVDLNRTSAAKQVDYLYIHIYIICSFVMLF